ncbi:DUF2961 domain-containing protein [Pelomyxa schiedti]|nr:DUF2961 domain-containing protein [Pelomyxa schiedti]
MSVMKVVWVLALVGFVLGDSGYFMSKQGDSCAHTCHTLGLNCNPHIVTNNSTALFQQLGVSCKADSRPWWAHDQPNYVVEPTDPNYQDCLGYTAVPGGVLCGASHPAVQRLCRCDDPSPSEQTFGFGLSSGSVTTTETIVFQHWLAEGDTGAMTHFWMTIPNGYENGLLVRYYVDGELDASIEFEPPLACGVGFGDSQAPWGIHWFGKGANSGSWFNNFIIPFKSSIVVTVQHTVADYGGFYMIVRGATNVPIRIGNLVLPSSSKLTLHKFSADVAPVTYVDFVNIASGSGLLFLHTIQVDSANLNFLEGCYHMYTGEQEFPGTVLSTGTEDYYDSGWYFDAGEFHMPVSGYTHYSNNDNRIQWSAYRLHEMDPLQFDDGMRFSWRNGDTVDAAGIKCMMEEGGTIIGTPSTSSIEAYTWVYTW